MKGFGLCYYYKYFVINDQRIVIMTWLNYFWWFYYAVTKDVVLFWFSPWSLYELFPAFICANNTGSPVNNLFGEKVFSPFASFNSFSSPSSDDIDVKSSSDGVYGKPPNLISSFSLSSVLSSDSSSSWISNQLLYLCSLRNKL